MNYKIKVKTLRDVFLTFTVNDYEVLNNFVCFTDRKTGEHLKFFSGNCEIVLEKNKHEQRTYKHT